MEKVLLILLAFIALSCNQEEPLTEEEIKDEVKTAWKGLYSDYENGDLNFINYYVDDVIRMDTDGSYKVGKDVFKKSWEEYYEENEVEILDYSEPTILPSQDQAVTFNTYEEIFVNKESNDTTLVEGTWIAIWKRQADESWKVRMSTWHN